MHQRPFAIAGREIGPAHPPYCIAEVGINHNGDLDTALRLIEVAKSAGADAVKFQTFKAEDFCGDPEQTFTYRSQGRTITEPMLEMFQRYQFTPAQWQAIKAHCLQVWHHLLFDATESPRSGFVAATGSTGHQGGIRRFHQSAIARKLRRGRSSTDPVVWDERSGRGSSGAGNRRLVRWSSAGAAALHVPISNATGRCASKPTDHPAAGVPRTYGRFL
ncbi:hypothetical protein Q3H58_001292 [Pseudomonas psychrotolerans]|nr:hypothetical protein [Pseudomonas psychrotolerans]